MHSTTLLSVPLNPFRGKQLLWQRPKGFVSKLYTHHGRTNKAKFFYWLDFVDLWNRAQLTTNTRTRHWLQLNYCYQLLPHLEPSWCQTLTLPQTLGLSEHNVRQPVGHEIFALFLPRGATCLPASMVGCFRFDRLKSWLNKLKRSRRRLCTHPSSEIIQCWFCGDELYFPWMSRLRNCMFSYMWAINRTHTLESSQSCFFKLRCLKPGFKLSPYLNPETWRHLRRNTGSLWDWLDHCNPVCQLSVHLPTLGTTPRHRVWGRGARLNFLWCFWQLNSAIECRMLWSSEILLSDG